MHCNSCKSFSETFCLQCGVLGYLTFRLRSDNFMRRVHRVILLTISTLFSIETKHIAAYVVMGLGLKCALAVAFNSEKLM